MQTSWTRLRNLSCANEITKHDGKGEWQTSVQTLPFAELGIGSSRVSSRNRLMRAYRSTYGRIHYSCGRWLPPRKRMSERKDVCRPQ